MNCLVRVIALSLVIIGLVGGSAEQEQKPAKATTPQKQASSPQSFGESYATLLPEQKRLVDDFVRRYNQTTDSKLTPEQAYNGARVSVRTTFDAVTHALFSTKLTNEKGQSLGLAIDLVEALDQVLGEEPGAGGDRQFRMYVYLKPNAMDILSRSRQFFHDKDNTIYHKGFPICFRLKNGPPHSIFDYERRAYVRHRRGLSLFNFSQGAVRRSPDCGELGRTCRRQSHHARRPLGGIKWLVASSLRLLCGQG